MMNLTIEPLIVPEAATDPAWQSAVALVNAAYAYDARCGLLAWDPEVMRSQMASHDHRITRGFVATVDGALIGVAWLEFDRSTERDVELAVCVDPAHRGRGYDDALYDRLEDEARRLGRSMAIDYKATPLDGTGMDDTAVLRPTSGIGGIPLTDENLRILRSRGYALGQIERASAYPRESDPELLRTLLEQALAVAGPDYEPVWWTGRTPDEYVDAYAYAVSRLSTDIPSGDLELEEEVWDAARIRAREDRVEPTGQQWAIAAVVHRPTGRIVAFNELVVSPDRSKPTENYGTIVVTEHRGHRLGTVVKCLGLLTWHDIAPESPCVFTFNAEENRHMLDVNERVGFVPQFWEGAWQKKLV